LSLLRREVAKLRSARVVHAVTGEAVTGIGVMGFGYEQNPDVDGTFVATLIDLTLPDEPDDRGEAARAA
jgi:hypothetical protein